MGHALAQDKTARIDSGLLQKRVFKILVSLLVHLNIYQLLCNSSKFTRNYPLLPHERNVCIMSSNNVLLKRPHKHNVLIR